MSSTSPSEEFARAEAFASVHRKLLGSDEEVTFGRFALIRPLGRGAHGRVYLAFDPTLEREVALKVMGAEGEHALRRGLQEGRALAKLRHPNLVQIHDVVREGNAIGLAMDRIDGPTLREWSRSEHSAHEVIELMVAVGQGLAALHDAELVHRDVKPANVVVDEQHGPRIIDLGLAREVREDTNRRLRSGTPGYLAPEQIDGIDVGPAADQFAWSVMFWEALTGHKPARDDEAVKVIPRRLQRILRRCLAEDPGQRYPNMAAVLRDIAAWRRARRWSRIGAAVLTGGAAVVGIQMALTPADPCGPPDPALAALWDADRSSAMQERLAALPAPTAGDLAERITAKLDADHVALVQTQRWVCEGQSAGGALSDEAFCVQQAASEFSTTVDMLETLDAAMLPDAADMVARTVPPHVCQSRPGAGPTDAEDLHALAAKRGELQGVANACALLGALACRERFEVLGTDDLPDGDCTLRPFVSFEKGRGLLNAGETKAAFDRLTEAAWAAESCGAGALEFRAKRLAAGLAAKRGDLEQAQWWLSATEATGRRLGDNEFREGELLLIRGVVTALEGDPRTSVEELRQAVARLEAEADTAGSVLSVAYVNLGQSARQAGMFAEAVDAIERGLSRTEERLGPTHPDVGRTLTSLGIALFQAGRVDDAVEAVTRAIGVFEPWAQRYPVDLAQALGNRGLMLRETGKLQDARASFERSLDVLRDAGESGVSPRISAMQNLGGTLVMLGDLDGGADLLAEALALQAERFPEDHPDVDGIRSSLAGVHLRREAFEDAALLACEVYVRAEARVGAGHRSSMIAAALCATADEALGRHAKVVETFTQEVVDAGPLSTDRGALRFAVAKSLWETGQRDRGVAVAATAMEDLVTDAEGRAEVEVWLERIRRPPAANSRRKK